MRKLRGPKVSPRGAKAVISGKVHSNKSECWKGAQTMRAKQGRHGKQTGSIVVPF